MNKRASEESLGDMDNNSKNQIEEIIYGLVYDLASASKSTEDYEQGTEYSFYSKILAEDKKFMDMVERIYIDKHKRFESGYRILRNI
jgi:hypothetical protein